MSEAKSIAAKVAAADKRLTHRAADHRFHPLARIGGSAAEIADQPPLVALAAATAAAGLATGRADLVRGGLRMLAAHGLATGIKTLIKHRIDRTRPKKALAEGRHRFRRGKSRDHDLNSFPSGHLAGAVAISRAAGHEIDGAALPAGVVTGGVAAAQAPAGNHYLSDMMAGAAIGWLSEALVGALFDAVGPTLDRAVRKFGR